MSWNDFESTRPLWFSLFGNPLPVHSQNPDWMFAKLVTENGLGDIPRMTGLTPLTGPTSGL